MKQLLFFSFLSPEKFVEKKSLPEHLYNPYIYIKKVTSRASNRQHRFEHPDVWNTSCNFFSHRRVYNQRVDEFDELQKASTMREGDMAISSESFAKKLSKEERDQAYAENAVIYSKRMCY